MQYKMLSPDTTRPSQFADTLNSAEMLKSRPNPPTSVELFLAMAAEGDVILEPDKQMKTSPFMSQPPPPQTSFAFS
jgi:hypothetical protein